MMFGTVAMMRPKAGKEADVVKHFDSWWAERGPKVPGGLAGDVRRNDANPGELFAVVTFNTKESYEANAQDPEQDAWYRRLVDLLEEEPRWMDGEILSRRTR